MNTKHVSLSPNPGRSGVSGFSLAEVVIAMGLLGLIIPSLIGMFGYFSSISVETRDRNDLKAVVSAVTLFLENGPPGASGEETHDFSTVYGWVLKASQEGAQAEVLYAYKPLEKPKEIESGFIVTRIPPGEQNISLMDGRIMAVEIQAAEEWILQKAVINPDVSQYPKAYLPLELHIYVVASADEPRTQANKLDSFPVVVSR